MIMREGPIGPQTSQRAFISCLVDAMPCLVRGRCQAWRCESVAGLARYYAHRALPEPCPGQALFKYLVGAAGVMYDRIPLCR